jgi:Transposase DDE domain group 1
VNGNSTRRVRIEAAGDGVVAHVGLHALGAFADRLGLGEALSGAVQPTGERAPVHDRGKVLTDAALMLAGGGECCADIEALRAEERLFGPVASDSTTYRTFRQIDPVTLTGLWDAIAGVRSEVWRRSSVTNITDPVVLDIDATLVEVQASATGLTCGWPPLARRCRWPSCPSPGSPSPWHRWPWCSGMPGPSMACSTVPVRSCRRGSSFRFLSSCS